MAESWRRTEDLTGRQQRVLELVARGKTNFEIAQELGISLDGAKWHLREIMAKLGCDTREEAVGLWLSRPSRIRRVASRAARLSGGAAWRLAAASIAGSIGAGAVLLVVLGGGDEATGEPATPSPQLSSTPTDATVVAPEWTGPVVFRTCGTSTFRRPTIAEMAQAFTNPRFAGPLAPGQSPNVSERPGPPYFAYYLAKVYQIIPRAVSGNIESTALSGVQQNGSAQLLIPASSPCDPAVLNDLSVNYYMFRFVDMVPAAMSLDSEVLTVEVDLLPGSTTLVTLPDPPVPAPAVQDKNSANGLPPLRGLRVQELDGTLLYSWGQRGTAQYSADDEHLEFATNAFGRGEIEFEIRGSAQTIVAYTGASQGATSATVLDTAGNSVASDPVQGAPNTWREIFRKELPTGTYRMMAGTVLVVPAGTALP